MYSGDKKQGKMPNPPDCRSYYAGYNKVEFLIKLRKGNHAPNDTAKMNYLKSLFSEVYIISVRTALNGRLYARMENGEEILITRRYAKEVEDCFMEDEDDERI